MKPNSRIWYQPLKYLALFLLITACNEEELETPTPDIENIQLNQTELTMYFGDQVQLEAQIIPETADSNLIWSSANEAVASVDNSGLVWATYSGLQDFTNQEALRGKETIISATSADGKISKTCKVSVFPKISICNSSHTPLAQFQKAGDSFIIRKVYLSKDNWYYFHFLDHEDSYWIGSPSDFQVNELNTLQRTEQFNQHFEVPESRDYDILIKGNYQIGLYFHPSAYFTEEVLYLKIGETKEAKLIDPLNQIQNPTWMCGDQAIATVKDGKVTGVSSGETTLTLNTDSGLCISCTVIVLPNEIDGTLHQPANCHIAPKSGKYHFRTVMGNSNSLIEGITSAEVLWEDLGTYVYTKTGDLITEVSYRDNFVTYVIPEDYHYGNSVIAVKDAAGKILWSWHIWLTEEPKEQTYHKYIYDEENSSWDNPIYYFTDEIMGIVMDRNIGAISDEPGGEITSPDQNSHSFGLLYQWGRKDPFPIYKARSSITWPIPVQSDKNTGNIEYSIAHPTTFMLGNAGNDDWYYFPKKGDTDNTRWSAVKTIYDPCPYGWRVPEHEIWSHLGNSYNEQRGGLLYDVSSSEKAWYPAAGRYNSKTGETEVTWYGGYYWSLEAYAFDIWPGTIFPTNGGGRAAGQSIRCIRDI